MAELKTKPTGASPSAFIDAIDDPARRQDCREIFDMMAAASGQQPVMWGGSIIGFGSLHYRYASGREGDWFRVGFSPRKQALTLYLMLDLDEQAARLGGARQAQARERVPVYQTAGGHRQGCPARPDRRFVLPGQRSAVRRSTLAPHPRQLALAWVMARPHLSRHGQTYNAGRSAA